MKRCIIAAGISPLPPSEALKTCRDIRRCRVLKNSVFVGGGGLLFIAFDAIFDYRCLNNIDEFDAYEQASSLDEENSLSSHEINISRIALEKVRKQHDGDIP